MKGLIMETCTLCGKLKKRNKVKYTHFSFSFVSDDDKIETSGYLCKKCIKKMKKPFSIFEKADK